MKLTFDIRAWFYSFCFSNLLSLKPPPHLLRAYAAGELEEMNPSPCFPFPNRTVNDEDTKKKTPQVTARPKTY